MNVSCANQNLFLFRERDSEGNSLKKFAGPLVKPAMATKLAVFECQWIRSGWLRPTIYWVLQCRGRYLSQNHCTRRTGSQEHLLAASVR